MEDFSSDEYNIIKESLYEMSGYLNGCIDFYDDTQTQDRNLKCVHKIREPVFLTWAYCNPSLHFVEHSTMLFRTV